MKQVSLVPHEDSLTLTGRYLWSWPKRAAWSARFCARRAVAVAATLGASYGVLTVDCRDGSVSAAASGAGW